MSVPTAATDRVVRAAREVPAVGAAPVATLLRGPRRPARVVAATRRLVAVRADDELIAVAADDAVALPCALTVSTRLPPVLCGDPAAVGDGQVELGGVRIRARRWRRVPQAHVTDPERCRARAARSVPPVDPALLARARALATAGGDPAALEAAVLALLGFGPGLTPAGDDVLAAALVTWHATGEHPRRDRLAAAVDAARPWQRTTAVSAGLLRHAASGRAVPALTALLDALDGPSDDLDAAHERLLRVGHTSGAALCLGLRTALGTPHPPAPNPPVAVPRR
ncbi:uncharacterized protein DUF2877 [Haloactinopolyspora alba]|uniref:Uncharacterized protein DUF2877 n=1 Tax=Haloactinopolyspora alba TaxID=648780 RepID=A0A2P8E3G4_9ACTN|nr:DUF2877 domain-containing protein [Haloactinopolyspora alba]PSL04013.1 uncharacterized protein DUF2877 [Haloactinopolyspora alba]